MHASRGRHLGARLLIAGLATATGLILLAPLQAAADPPWPSADTPAYPHSPFHGLRDGDGNPIPCRCRFQGRDYRLGDEVCMTTHAGTVMTRCDLLLNNTSWIPTTAPCTIGRAPAATPIHHATLAPTLGTHAKGLTER